MDNSLRWFRVLLVFSTVPFVWFYFLPFLTGHTGGSNRFSEVQDAYDGLGAVYVPNWSTYLAICLSGVIVPVMAFFFVPVARWLFVGLQFLLWCSTLLWGLRVMTPTDQFLSHVVTLMDGGVLAMMFFNEKVRNAFIGKVSN